MSFRAKILGLCAILASFTILIGVLGRSSLKEVVALSAPIGTEVLPKTLRYADLRAQFRELRIQLRSLGLRGLTPEQIRQTEEAAGSAIEKMRKAIKELDSLPMDAEEKRLFVTATQAIETFLSEGREIKTWAHSGNPADHDKLNRFFIDKCPVLAANVYKDLLVLTEYDNKIAHDLVERSEAVAHYNMNLTMYLVIGGFILSIILGLFGAQYLSNSLIGLIAGVADVISSGSSEVAKMAKELRSTSVKVAENSTKQVREIQQTADSTQEISSMVRQTEQNSEMSLQSSKESSEVAKHAQEAVISMKTSIDGIQESNKQIITAVDTSVKELGDVVRIISDIGSKTKVINDIVFQTKLLSFNASVEAARAGEHGKGFAVVAEEVGNLAQMSGKASHEIGELLDQSVRRVQSMAEDIERKIGSLIEVGQARVAEGVEKSEQCSKILDQIVDRADRMYEMISSIANTAREQSKGVQEIAASMDGLNRITSESASATEEVSENAISLSEESVRLQEAAAKLMASLSGAKETNDNSYGGSSSVGSNSRDRNMSRAA